MIVSLHLLRYRAGTATREYLRAVRHLKRSAPRAVAAHPIVLAGLNEHHFPLAQPTAFGVLATWRDADTAAGFAADAPLARHWGETASEQWHVTLRAHKSRGTWFGEDPLPEPAGAPPPEGPVVIVTNGRARTPRSAVPFWANNPSVVRHLRDAGTVVWDQGWAADLRDAGTLSLWRSLSDATDFAYGSGGEHRAQVKAMRDGRWNSEFWYARMTPVASSGTWGGQDPLHLAA